MKDNVHYPFYLGGTSSMIAAACTHPLDLAKVRMQMSGDHATGFLQTIAHVARKEGPRALYAGLSASLLRQATYSTTRFGVYEELKARVTDPSFGALVAMASLSGLAGAIVGNPADVLNVRMQNDLTLPPDRRRNYKHALDGLRRMTQEEGIASLFRGVGANGARGVLMTASQLASYDLFKSALLRYGVLKKDNLVCHFSASFLAGFVATTVCSPFDVVKTRIMSAKGDAAILTVVREALAKEGYAFMLRGWGPSFVRLMPQTVITMLVLEQQKKLYRALM
ncbi:putative dicarboxylate carrier protein [Protomyces lactucae-debilis]|uniref:Putative dicarboxylate carrier protein n=1 Tax=Protomyces lactucae-debilis TaxID=2754530 RepID=A0A1Y2FBI2_PROLT|nr:putative dicarboxylate carrier protein [Protomyces lactucae-debilis]ORY80804.1 putative dicarboxylate carrier protein [Protomyces lactucae-debilis]